MGHLPRRALGAGSQYAAPPGQGGQTGVQDYEDYDALGLAALVREGEVTESTLLDAAIERCEKRNPSLNAVVIPMLEQARAALAAGLTAGPFRGVPFLLKDLTLQTKGDPYRAGARFLKELASSRTTTPTSRRSCGPIYYHNTE